MRDPISHNIKMFIKQCVFEYFLTPDQKLNENPAGVRLIHLPTGLIIDSFSTKNRITNKNIAKDRLEKYGNPLIGIKTKGNFKLNPENHTKAITLAQSKEAIVKRKNTLKKINHQKGEKNSQFGKHIYVPANITQLPSNSELNSNKHKFKINEQPYGWILISEWRESRKNKSNSAYGKHWYNDGTNNYLIFETESFGLVRGRLINKN